MKCLQLNWTMNDGCLSLACDQSVKISDTISVELFSDLASLLPYLQYDNRPLVLTNCMLIINNNIMVCSLSVEKIFNLIQLLTIQ